MEIFCNQKEFAALVRQCYRCAKDKACDGCLFAPVCSAGADMHDDQVMSRIEDICEVLPGG